MTIYHLADNVTVSSASPVLIIEVPSSPSFQPLATQTWQFEVNGAATCTAAFQPVGSLDERATLPPEGVGGAWSNIGATITITCTSPGITPAVTTVTNTTLFARYGVIVSSISGTGAAATAKLLA